MEECLNKIKFMEEGDILEKVSDGYSGALLYVIKRKREKFFLKIFNKTFDYKEIDLLKKKLNIYKELNINSLEIIDSNKIGNLDKYYIVYNYIDGQNLKEFTNLKKSNSQYIRYMGRKIGKQLNKLREYNKYDKNLFEFKDINKLTETIIENFKSMLKDEKIIGTIQKYFNKSELKNLETKLKKYKNVLKNIEPKLIHGDIKRSNIMIDKSKKLYIIDVESMQLNYDVMNFLYQMTWALFKENHREAEFVSGYFDGIYNNQRPKNFNEQILFITILNFFNESYHMYKKLNLDKLNIYMSKCSDLFKDINNIDINKFLV